MKRLNCFYTNFGMKKNFLECQAWTRDGYGVWHDENGTKQRSTWLMGKYPEEDSDVEGWTVLYTPICVYVYILHIYIYIYICWYYVHIHAIWKPREFIYYYHVLILQEKV